jgi:hypothetical protein
MTGVEMRRLALICLTATMWLPGCKHDAPPGAGEAVSNTTATQAAAQVARIVFIDQQEACECTRKRIDDTWAALQTALGSPATLAVERIHLDTEAVRAEKFTAYKPLMVPPGVYFLDAGDVVVEMLQGEVTTEQIAAVLRSR